MFSFKGLIFFLFALIYILLTCEVKKKICKHIYYSEKDRLYKRHCLYTKNTYTHTHPKMLNGEPIIAVVLQKGCSNYILLILIGKLHTKREIDNII